MAPRSRSEIKNVRRTDQRRKAENRNDSWDEARSQRRVLWFGGSIALIVIALAGAWFFVASQVNKLIERELEGLNRPDQTVTCAGQDIVGFPFRMGLKCDGIQFASRRNKVSVEAGTLRTAAQVYAPRHQIVELQSPVRITSPQTIPTTIDWDSARSSIRIDSNNALQRIILEINEISASTSLPDAPARALIKLGRLFSVAEPYAIQGDGAPTDLRLFVQADSIVPSGISLPPLSFQGTLALDEGTVLLSNPEGWLDMVSSLRNPIRLEGVTVQSGNTIIELSGQLSLSSEGLLNGTLRLAGQGLEEGLQALQAGIDPRATELKQTVDTIVPTILALALPDPDNPKIRNAPPITIRDGQISLGLLPMGTIAPINMPGR
ncbi:MAG: DUF2125 domain-containing protein [Pseudomonadota bacterium]